MPDNLSSIDSNEAELKDYYDNYKSVYEAIKRRRKKAMDKRGIMSEESIDFDKVPDPDV